MVHSCKGQNGQGQVWYKQTRLDGGSSSHFNLQKKVPAIAPLLGFETGFWVSLWYFPLHLLDTFHCTSYYKFWIGATEMRTGGGRNGLQGQWGRDENERESHVVSSTQISQQAQNLCIWTVQIELWFQWLIGSPMAPILTTLRKSFRLKSRSINDPGQSSTVKSSSNLNSNSIRSIESNSINRSGSKRRNKSISAINLRTENYFRKINEGRISKIRSSTRFRMLRVSLSFFIFCLSLSLRAFLSISSCSCSSVE